jgi:uncharacterized membrane protein
MIMLSRWFLASLALFVLVAIGTTYVSIERERLFPEKVPTHWGPNGKPDAFTSREALLPMLWIMPSILLGLVLLGRALPWMSPNDYTIETFRPTYEYVFFLVTLLLAYLHTVILLTQMQILTDVSRCLVGGLFVLFAAMGNVMGKVRKNFFVGIRTPWTLASDTVWEATHRVGAWCFVGIGLLGLALLFTPLPAIWLLALVVVLPLIPVFYSLWLYKRLQAEGRLEKPEANG